MWRKYMSCGDCRSESESFRGQSGREGGRTSSLSLFVFSDLTYNTAREDWWYFPSVDTGIDCGALLNCAKPGPAEHLNLERGLWLIWPLAETLPVPSREICFAQLCLTPILRACPWVFEELWLCCQKNQRGTREVLLSILHEALAAGLKARSLLPSSQTWVSTLHGLAIHPVLT